MGADMDNNDTRWHGRDAYSTCIECMARRGIQVSVVFLHLFVKFRTVIGWTCFPATPSLCPNY